MNAARTLILSPRKRSKSILNRTSNVPKLCSPATIQTPIKLSKSTPIKYVQNKYKQTPPIPFLKPYSNRYHPKKSVNDDTNTTDANSLNSSFLSLPFSNTPIADRYIANRSRNRGLNDRFSTASPESSLNNAYRSVLKTELLFDAPTAMEVSSPNMANFNIYHDYDTQNDSKHDENIENNKFAYCYATNIDKNQKYFVYNKGASPISDNHKLSNTPITSPQTKVTNQKRIDCFQSPKRCLSFGNSDMSGYNEYNSGMQTTPIRTETQYKIYNLRNSNENTTQSNQGLQYNSDAYHVLDAPGLIDDFYSSILDWNENANLITVSLKDSLYLYDPMSKQTLQLIENTKNRKLFGKALYYSRQTPNPIITSVKFAPNGHCVAVGTDCGVVSIWDIEKGKCVKAINHNNNDFHIGVLEWSHHWNSSCITYGSKLNQSIGIIDLRETNHKSTKTIATPTKCVSLKWSNDLNKFAIGGRDRCVSIYDIRYLQSRVFKLKYHSSSIRAIAWSPHNYNVLMSGGGALDKKICLWNLNSVNQFKHSNNYIDGKCITINKPIKSIQTRSQICNIVWNPFKSDEILSTNGYESNDINIWNVNQSKIVKTLRGHTERVLYVALSADKKDIVTASNDETLRFWNVFSENSCKVQDRDSNDFDLCNIR